MDKKPSTGSWSTTLWHVVEKNNLMLVVNKTKETIEDLKRNKKELTMLPSWKGVVAKEHEYIGVHLNKRQNYKGKSRLY